MKTLLLSFLIWVIVPMAVLAQNCSPSTCSYGDRGGANCHRFVFEFMDHNYSLPYDISCNYNSLTTSQRNVIYNASQGIAWTNWAALFNYYFEEVSSISNADVVAYEKNGEVTHSAVVLRSSWPVTLISKWESTGPVVKHGLNEVPDEYYTCGNGQYQISYWRWTGHGDDDGGGTPTCTPSSVSITGTHNSHEYGGSCTNNSLYTYNQVCPGQITVTLNAVSGVRYEWTRTSGSASFTTSSNGRYAYIYLYSGSAAFSIQPYNSCNQTINTPRSVYFSASSISGPGFYSSEPKIKEYKVEVRDFSGQLLKTEHIAPDQLSDKILKEQEGLYIIHIYDSDGKLVKVQKYFGQ